MLINVFRRVLMTVIAMVAFMATALLIGQMIFGVRAVFAAEEAPFVVLCDAQGNEKSIEVTNLSGFNPKEDVEEIPLSGMVITPEMFVFCPRGLTECYTVDYVDVPFEEQTSNFIKINSGELIALNDLWEAMRSGDRVQTLAELNEFVKNR